MMKIFYQHLSRYFNQVAHGCNTIHKPCINIVKIPNTACILFGFVCILSPMVQVVIYCKFPRAILYLPLYPWLLLASKQSIFCHKCIVLGVVIMPLIMHVLDTIQCDLCLCNMTTLCLQNHYPIATHFQTCILDPAPAP